MAPKFALFTKGSKLPLNKGFKNMFELLQSWAQPSIYYGYSLEAPSSAGSNEYSQHMFSWRNKKKCQNIFERKGALPGSIDYHIQGGYVM